MGLTQEEADFLDSLTALPSARPLSFPLKHKEPRTRPGSNSLRLYTGSYKVASNFTGPPSPSVSNAAGSTPDPGTNLASSLWPQKGDPSYSFPPSTLLSSTSSEPQPNSEAGADEIRRVYLPPISPSRKSGPSESLPPLIPRLPRPSTPPTSSTYSTPSTPPTPSKKTSRGITPFLLRSPSVNWGRASSGSSNVSSDQDEKKGAFWTAIQAAGVPIYLGTPGFDVLALCPSALGTYCSPASLLTVLSDIEVFYHVYAAGQKLSREDFVPSKGDPDSGVLQHAADMVLAQYGTALIEQNAGQHFTFINVKQGVTSNTIVRRARRLVQQFQENGIEKDQIVVSIPATEEGVHATQLLVKEDGVLVNLAMVAGMSHAAVCAEAGAAWVTFHLDRLEKVYDDRGEPLQGIEAVQSTIALFHMHNVNTKIMISGFRDTHKILAFPGAHGFSLTREQIVAAQLPTTRSCRIPPQSASSLPGNAITQAKKARWPPQFFDPTEAGGSNGTFVRHFSSRLQTILLSTQSDLFYHMCLAIRDFLAVIRDDVVNYRIFMAQLSNPHTGLQTLAHEGVRGLRRRVNLRKDLKSAETEWKGTITGRVLPDVEWRTAKVGKCEAWITPDGRIEAQIPEDWDRRKAASMNVYADC